MAEEKKNPVIGDIKTFSAKIQTETLESALKKFNGRRTISTVMAARRIAAKKREVKIPRNLLRQLFRLTGGFRQEQFVAPEIPEKDSFDYLQRSVADGGYKMFALAMGKMEVVFLKDNRGSLRTNYGPQAWLFFRSKLVACTSGNKYCWLDDNRVSGAVASLGVEFKLPPK